MNLSDEILNFGGFALFLPDALEGMESVHVQYYHKCKWQVDISCHWMTKSVLIVTLTLFWPKLQNQSELKGLFSLTLLYKNETQKNVSSVLQGNLNSEKCPY